MGQITKFTITEKDFATLGQFDEWEVIIEKLQDIYAEQDGFFDGSSVPVLPSSYHDTELREICYCLENYNEVNYIVISSKSELVSSAFFDNKLFTAVMKSPEKFI